MAQEVIDRIIAIGRRRRAPRKHIKAALETGRIESNFENLPGGDADSQGWRQERASLYRDPRNLKASINRFYDEAKQLDRGQRARELAADVQRPAEQYRGRYGTASDEANRLLRGSGGRAPRRPADGPQRPSTATGVDPAANRRALLQQYVLGMDEDPNALLSLALGLAAPEPASRTSRSAKDAPRGNRSQSRKSTLTPGGAFAGSNRPAVQLARIAKQHGLTVTSKKRATVNTASGNVSDHFAGNKVATARDLSGTPEQMSKAARAIANELGIKSYKPGSINNVTKNGLRFQLIYGTSDHLDHVHVGVKNV